MVLLHVNAKTNITYFLVDASLKTSYIQCILYCALLSTHYMCIIYRCVFLRLFRIVQWNATPTFAWMADAANGQFPANESRYFCSGIYSWNAAEIKPFTVDNIHSSMLFPIRLRIHAKTLHLTDNWLTVQIKLLTALIHKEDLN